MTAVAASNQHDIREVNNESSRSSTAQTNQPAGQFDGLLGPVTFERQESNQGSTGDAKHRGQSTKIDGTNRCSGRAFTKRSPPANEAHVVPDPPSSLLEAFATERNTLALLSGVETENGETHAVAKDLQSFAAGLGEFVASKADQCDFQIGGPTTGTVWVSLRMHEVGGVCIEFRTTDISKRKQLDLQVPKLLASLRAQGINVISFTATFDNSLAGDSAPPYRNANQPEGRHRKGSIKHSTDAAENEDAGSGRTNIYTA